jgi:hypothetical protein
MSQQQKLIRLPLAALFFLGLLALAYFVIRKRSSANQEGASAVSGHAVETSPEDALQYWTAEKMRKAKPARMPRVKKVEPEKQPPKRAPRKS